MAGFATGAGVFAAAALPFVALVGGGTDFAVVFLAATVDTLALVPLRPRAAAGYETC